ncbi:tumor necrosis factor receptor superfamily member 10A-like isoform X3 [Cygnus olor]|uniref:tumor necrosis factor receptor superfamily member 10A-like isoform X3 n=1 Tax=Cygnus olor TaxID=8869 RepID=UPI001ADE76CE|nr:tumor necrosis factor receptor superfamily member 10A-like isoform X3 [Cygnus olor]
MFGEAALRWFLTRSAPRRMRSALRPSSRRGCLPLLLAKAVLSTAAAVEVRRDRVDLLELSRKGEDFYQVQDSGWFCRMCPAGTYVAEHCKEQNGSSTCLPCEADGYVEYPSHFSRCLRCWTCREDQVELSPCSATRNTQCICKNGTFCSPDHPCEMCQKCQSRCPSGQVKIAPCTPHSDLLCGPPTGSFSGSYSKFGAAGGTGARAGGVGAAASTCPVLPVIIIVIIVAVAVVLLLVLLWKCCCRHPAAGDSRDLGRKSGNVVHYLVLQLTRRWRGGLGTRDNIRNEHLSRDQEQGLLPAVGAPSAPGLEEVVAMTSDPSVKTQKILVPVPGEDPVILLRRSFHVFARDVPFKDWKRYGRALDLLENDLALAEMNDKYSQEPFFQMLNMWQNKQGMSASVNTLLEALHRIDLGGIAEDISSKLVQQGSFQYQVS